ncbi:MAG TPA: GNAT family N-acetyltransferase [Dokdonella sp.]|uniref:GNAT family N-acetyltransferase n=1 Tax=Dokdonella sp. TaxID=2291710 RepID=UPI002B8BD245|nr:GNAT family N-acetyltransferase [Dokdonella sp.]HUD42797.1 GNAT family N-acetyltransferase [Dokdonella sp.]
MNSITDTIAAPEPAARPVCRLRHARHEDAAELAAFAARTFEDTYGHDMPGRIAPEHIALHLATAFGPQQQAAELADPGVVTVLADCDGRLAAYAQVRRAVVPPCVGGRAPVELHRLYVDRRWHGSGIGQQLIAEVFAIASSRFGGATLWLKVWERNARAIAFYAKCGFADVGIADYFVGGDRQTDRVLVRPLDRQTAERPVSG